MTYKQKDKCTHTHTQKHFLIYMDDKHPKNLWIDEHVERHKAIFY